MKQHNYKIDDKLTLYINLGAMSHSKEYVTLGEVLDVDTQEQLDAFTEEEVRIMCSTYYEEWLFNHDIGWYIEQSDE